MKLRKAELSAEASVAQARTQLDQAQVNLGRTRLLSPVDGYVTNLLAQLGDYVNVGVSTISVVDLGCRRQFILDRRVFRGDQPRAYPCGGSG
jgi:multidrug resistance efflux pump